MEGKRSAEEIRALVEKSDPALLRLMDDLKQRFGAKLVALRVADVSIGWGRWLEQRAAAVRYEPVPDMRAAHEEWKRIRAASIKAGEAALRRPTSARA